VGPVLVVLLSPVGNNLLGLTVVGKSMPVQAVFPQLPIEALDVGVLPGTAGGRTIAQTIVGRA